MEKNKLITLNSITLFIVFMIPMTFLSKSVMSVYLSLALLLITTVINIKCSNDLSLKKSQLVLLFVFSAVTLILPLYDSYFFDNIRTTLLVLTSIILLYLCIGSQENRDLIINKTFKIFTFVTNVLVIYGLLLYIFGNKSIYYIDISSAEFYQSWNIAGLTLIQSACGDPSHGYYVGSLTNNPNALSYICIISLIYAINFEEKKQRKIFQCLLLLVGILISGSRLAKILFPIIIIARIIFAKTNIFKTRKRLLIYLAMFLILLLLLINFNTIFNSIDYNGRLENWQIGFKNMSFIGHGINSDNIYLRNYLNHNASMHNSYISLFVNYGWMLASVIVIFFIATLAKMVNNYNNSKDNIFVIILFLTLLIVSLAESTFLVYGCFNYLFFYMIFYFYLEVKKHDNTIHTKL